MRVLRLPLAGACPVSRLPIRGVPAHCGCRWDWRDDVLHRVLVTGCVVHGEPDDVVIAWLRTPALAQFAVGIACGTEPLRFLPEFCSRAVRAAGSNSAAGRVWRKLGRSWESVDWNVVIATLRGDR